MREVVVDEAHRDGDAGRHEEGEQDTWDQNLHKAVHKGRGQGHQGVGNSCQHQDPLAIETICHVAKEKTKDRIDDSEHCTFDQGVPFISHIKIFPHVIERVISRSQIHKNYNIL